MIFFQLGVWVGRGGSHHPACSSWHCRCFCFSFVFALFFWSSAGTFPCWQDARGLTSVSFPFSTKNCPADEYGPTGCQRGHPPVRPLLPSFPRLLVRPLPRLPPSSLLAFSSSFFCFSSSSLSS